VNFGEHDISKYLNNLFLVLEQTNRISLVSFSMINHGVGGIVFKRRNQTIIKCLYNLFLAIDRIILADFSNLQCVVYASVYRSFPK